ncbi:MAG TPA: hypothetical protein VK846_17745 [Candidatus Limnocylindria bacterium]|nr:hypothetical protein [Candidatus Limnocylindria bacterium]
MKPETSADRKTNPKISLTSGALGVALAVTVSLATGIGRAAEAEAATPPPPPPSRVHALLNFEFSDKYLTPRGMIVHDDGFTFQQLALGFANVYQGEKFLNDVTLVGGVWNDFSSDGVSVHAPFGSKPKTHWVEIDPIAGISAKFAKNFQLDVTYTAFNMQILDIGTSQHLETKLGYDDTSLLGAFALHPYFLYWQELDGKATAAQVPYIVFAGQPGPDSSYYFEFGIAPSYTCKKIGLKLEAPCRVLLPNEDFYGEFYDDASAVGLFELGLKASMPMNFMPQGYGHWSFHVGFKYMNFVDENLRGMQQFNAPGKSVNDTTQVFAGISTFF